MIFAEVRAKTGTPVTRDPQRSTRRRDAHRSGAPAGGGRGVPSRGTAPAGGQPFDQRGRRGCFHTLYDRCARPRPRTHHGPCASPPNEISRGSVERTCALALMQRRPTPGLDTARGVPLRATLFSNRSTAMVRPRAPRPSPRRFAWRPHPAPRLLTDRLGQRYAGADESLERRAE